jgi:hypothetical protein
MKTNFTLTLFLFLAVAMLVAGCATHRIDWKSRVGNYTFDQAVTEFGPPDKQAKLSDGRLVAEWVTRYSNGGTMMIGSGFYGRPGGVGVVQTTPSYYESKLRLTFHTNNVLAAWAKN